MTPESTALAPNETLTKPLLRGVSHQVACFVAAVACAALVIGAKPGTPRIAVAVFGVCLVNLFATSALYHRIDWSVAARKRMRRLDHAAIFLLIGGGYTPLFAIVPSTAGGHGALVVIWAGVALGVMKSLVWSGAPKPVTAVLCVGVGWVAAGQVLDRGAVIGAAAVRPLVACGIVYSLGALVYALKRPDPLPRIFGYHEVFHALVVIASVLLYVHVALVLRATL